MMNIVLLFVVAALSLLIDALIAALLTPLWGVPFAKTLGIVGMTQLCWFGIFQGLVKLSEWWTEKEGDDND